jgi:hypothetical protein
MPTSAVIAGLVMAAVLGTGALALGAYTVHRYMNWRCRELVDLFQRNTVRVVKIEDLESRRKSRGSNSDEEEGGHAAAREQMSQRSQRQRGNDENQHMTGLRGGFDLEIDPDWAQQRQMQAHASMPVPAHTQPATHRRALEWHQSGTPYEQLWQPPSIFQQVPPQGGWFAYIPPQPDTAPTNEQRPVNRPRPHSEVIKQFAQERTSGGRGQQARRERRLDPATASLLQTLLIEPVSFEGDIIEVIDEYPSVIEGVIHTKRKINRTRRQGEDEEHRQSSSTELGTCSSSQSASSTEDIPRDCIPEHGPRRAYLPSHDHDPKQQYAQHTARAEGSGNPYVRQSCRSRSRRKRKQNVGVRSGSQWRSSIDGRQQAGTASSCLCIDTSFLTDGVCGPG